MKRLLTNEERLRRRRERWARNNTRRKNARAECRAAGKPTEYQRRNPRERLITPAMMKMGEYYFYTLQRGQTVPASTTAGVFA